MPKKPKPLERYLDQIRTAARDAWDALSPVQQRELRDAYSDEQNPRVRVRTKIDERTRQALEGAELLEPTPRRARWRSRSLTPEGLLVRAADPELAR